MLTDQRTDVEHDAGDGRINGAETSSVTTPQLVEPTSSSNLLQDVVCNFKAGLKVMSFQRVAPEDFRHAAENIALLVILVLAVDLFFDFVLVGFNGHFRFSELPNSLFSFPLMFLTGLLISKVSRKRVLISA